MYVGDGDENTQHGRLKAGVRQLERELASPGGLMADLLRNLVIEECAKAIESAPLTYAGPDPQGVSDLRYLIVAAIRDLKAEA